MVAKTQGQARIGTENRQKRLWSYIVKRRRRGGNNKGWSATDLAAR